MGSTTMTTDLVSRDHDKLLLQGARDMREDSILVDFTLEVEDENFPVHKVILASVSGYFRSLFNSGMNEIRQSSVSLEGLTADSVKTLVNFVYTGTLQISPDTVQDIFTVAHYLQMSSAIDLCSDYILKNLTWENVTEVENLAKLFALDGVQTKVKEFMFKNFLYIPNDVANSLGKQIVKLSGSNSLGNQREMDIFEKLKSLQPSMAEEDFYEALCMVRFPLMFEFDLEEVMVSRVISARSQHLLDEAVEYQRDMVEQSRKQSVRTQIRSDDISIVLATANSIDLVSQHEKIPSISLEKSDSHRRFVRIVTIDNFLYVCVNKKRVKNVQDDCTRLYRYDPRSDIMIKLHRLQMKRKAFPLVAYQDQIFAIGGEKTQTMEVYDINSDKWRFCSDINFSNVSSEGVAMGNKIYVCGGHVKEENASLDTLSCYDPADDSWKILAPMNRTRHKHDVFALKGRIYVFRGDSGSISVSMEYYNPSVDQWTLLDRDLDQSHSNVMFCLIGSVIFQLSVGDSCYGDRVVLSFEEFRIGTDDETSTDSVNSAGEWNGFMKAIPVKPSRFDIDKPGMSDRSLMASSLVFPNQFWNIIEEGEPERATHVRDPPEEDWRW